LLLAYYKIWELIEKNKVKINFGFNFHIAIQTHFKSSIFRFLLSYVPGGENGLRWMGKMAKMAFCAKQTSTLVLPI
jgi:hypothetical protein